MVLFSIDYETSKVISRFDLVELPDMAEMDFSSSDLSIRTNTVLSYLYLSESLVSNNKSLIRIRKQVLKDGAVEYHINSNGAQGSIILMTPDSTFRYNLVKDDSYYEFN